MLKRRSWLALLVIALVVAATFAATASSKPAARSAGNIEVLSLWGGSEKDAFLKVTAAFKQATGINVEYTSARDFVPVIRTRLAAGNPPDVAIIPRPGVLTDLAKQGAVKDLGTMGISKAYLTARYSPAWIKLGTVNGKIYGVAAKANSKSVMWYRPDQFKKYKLKTPKTWAQLIAITKLLKAKGQTPWAQGAKDSWTLTDWFENTYARTAGPAKYLSLFAGKTKFTDPSVKKAIQQMLQVLNEQVPGRRRAGRPRYRVRRRHRPCLRQEALGSALLRGRIRRRHRVGSGEHLAEGRQDDQLVLLADDQPEVRPADGRRRRSRGGVQRQPRRAQVPAVHLPRLQRGESGCRPGAIISPNKQLKKTAYPNILVQKEAAQVASAKVFLFDGSDTLPGTLADDWGAALQNALRSREHQQPPV